MKATLGIFSLLLTLFATAAPPEVASDDEAIDWQVITKFHKEAVERYRQDVKADPEMALRWGVPCYPRPDWQRVLADHLGAEMVSPWVCIYCQQSYLPALGDHDSAREIWVYHFLRKDYKTFKMTTPEESCHISLDDLKSLKTIPRPTSLPKDRWSDAATYRLLLSSTWLGS